MKITALLLLALLAFSSCAYADDIFAPAGGQCSITGKGCKK